MEPIFEAASILTISQINQLSTQQLGHVV